MISRRTALKLTAGAVPLAGLALYQPQEHHWKGRGFGADLSVTVLGDAKAAQHCFSQLETQIDQLENIFSLYRPDSALSCLNRDGFIQNPPAALVQVLKQSQKIWRLSNGAFDPTVQSIWQNAKGTVGLEHLQIAQNEISFKRSGMALTLNGIAQGFASDQIAAHLQAHGFEQHLVNMGEWRAGQAPWRIGVENLETEQLMAQTLENMSIATSQPGAMHRRGGGSHIIHPQGGQTLWKSVTVTAKEAAIADGISTAAVFMTRAEVEALDWTALGISSVWQQS